MKSYPITLSPIFKFYPPPSESEYICILKFCEAGGGLSLETISMTLANARCALNPVCRCQWVNFSWHLGG